MKKIIVVFIFVSAFAFSQNNPQMPTIQDFADEVALSIAPSLGDVSITGNTWMDWDGFPGLSGGVSMGAVLIPTESLGALLTELGNDIPDELLAVGAPVPALVFSIGGVTPLLPLRLGFRYGWVPQELIAGFFDNPVTMDYQLIGLDADYRLWKQNLIIPSLSVGGSFALYNTSLNGPFGSALIFEEVPYFDGSDYVQGNLEFSDPDMGFSWSSQSYSIRANAAWNFGLFSLNAGAVSTWAMADFRLNIDSEEEISIGVFSGQDAVDQVNQGIENTGGAFPFFTSQGIYMDSSALGWSPALTAGASLNLGPMKWFLNTGFNFSRLKLMGELALRVQL